MSHAEPPNESNSWQNACMELEKQHQDALEAGRMGDAEAAALNLLAIMAQHGATEPNAEMLVLTEAASQEAAADWRGAEVTYRRLLEQAIATGEATSQYRAHAALSGLYQLLGDHDKAVEQARSATEAARRADLPILLASALEQQATCALRQDLLSEAMSAIEEALRCTSDERVYELQRGRCLIVQAECKLKAGRDAAAESDLNAAWQLLDKQSTMQMAAGVHATVARYWSVKAGLQDQQGDWHGAVQAWNNAVACRRHVSELPHVEGPYPQNALAETLAAYGRAQLAAGDRKAAEELLAESDAIREKTGLP
jgi:tetratricopeptide (TPR) repeat protein